MSKVSIRVNDRAFSIGCEPGQEDHVQALGEVFDQKVTELAAQVGQIGDLRLFLMAALVITDELETLKKQSGSNDLADNLQQVEQAAARCLDDAAQQIERIIKQLA